MLSIVWLAVSVQTTSAKRILTHTETTTDETPFLRNHAIEIRLHVVFERILSFAFYDFSFINSQSC